MHPHQHARCLLRSALTLLVLAPALLAQSLRQTIDAEIRSAWAKQKTTPAPKSDDSVFLRRVFLDLVGVIPTAAEVRMFLDDSDAKKREKIVEKLLADPRFATHQANVWDLVLFGRHPQNQDATRKRDGFKNWLTERFAKNDPYDKWVRELMLAEQQGSELFHVQYRNQPEEETVAVSRIFLGTQLQCARCHDHPFDTLTQRDFYGMAGFFVRLVVLESGSGPARRFTIGERSSGDVLFTGSAKELKPGQKGEPIKPRFLSGAALEEPALPMGFKEPDYRTAKSLPKPVFSRKEKLAAWLTAADNPYFAKAAVNRVWGQFMGRGIVHPVDDLGGKNPPSHPALLQSLTDSFVKSKFDLKSLIRELVNSETYQLAGTGSNTEALPRWFERARVRPLSAEELLASIQTAAGSRDLKVGNVEEYFVRYFGEPTNGQGEFQGSLTEHLFLNHGDEVRRYLYRKPGNLLDTLLSSKEPWEKRVDHLFLSVLGRLPKETERAKFVAYLSANPKPDSLAEEAIWVLVNTSEFRFNH